MGELRFQGKPERAESERLCVSRDGEKVYMEESVYRSVYRVMFSESHVQACIMYV